VTLRDLPEVVVGKPLRCEVIHPEETEWKECACRLNGSILRVKVPLGRGCAMVRLLV
jgi:hypothetical protein